MGLFATRVVWDLETLQVVERDTFKYNGPVDLLCGASSGQKTAAAQEASVAGNLNAELQQIFGTNTNILSSITDALEPVVGKGPEQYGFSPAQDAAIRTQATAQNATASQQTTNAVRSAQAARGGGNMLIPSGSEAAIEGALAESQAQKQADTQLGITEKGYDTGRQNFFTAEGELAGAPGALENPITSAGNAAENAAATSMQGQTDIANANNAWIAPVAGLVGDVGSAALTGGMSKAKGNSSSD